MEMNQPLKPKLKTPRCVVTRHSHSIRVTLRLRDAVRKMETTVAKEGVHTGQQHAEANNGGEVHFSRSAVLQYASSVLRL